MSKMEVRRPLFSRRCARRRFYTTMLSLEIEVRRETIVCPEMELISVSTGPVIAGDGGEEGDHCLAGDGAHRRFYGTLISPKMEVMRVTIIWPEMESSEVIRTKFHTKLHLI
ncbi:hypothetical protein L6452_05708 [Arctium lappa]|uniref:Uncharacterized protein n=1 Tax=Arctium lappa TaxID=4217 RepID=A0ACB9EI72_ARCLA|nr:hypothetical protein L6452_05708 [Arctium lappa]